MYIYNAKINTMENLVIENGYIKIENGKITEVCGGIPSLVSDNDINAMGKLVLPGFIDAHTHLGIIEDGLGFEGDDSYNFV